MPRHSERVRLGRSGVAVTRLSVGTAAFGGLFTSVSDADANATVAAALAAGIGYLDTAPQYGHGVAEERLGRALRAAGALAPDGGATVTISTKVGRLLVDDPGRDPGLFADAALRTPVFDFSARGVQRSLEESLTRLGLSRVDIALIHDPDDHEEQALTEAYPALAKLRAQGVVRAIGVGMNDPRIPTRFVRETDINVVLIAGRYSLLDQRAGAELLPAAAERGVAVVVGGVFNSGILTDPKPGATFDYTAAPAQLLRRAQAIRDLLARYDVPLPAAALQYPLRHPAVTTVLVGMRSAAEVAANVADIDRAIPAECWAALDSSGLLRAP